MPSVYAQLTDAVDAALDVADRHLLKADVYVDAMLRERDIDPDDLSLPIALLTEIAATWALRLAAIEGAMGENSTLIDKAKQYERTADTLIKSISRKGLGLPEVTGAGPGYFSLGRG